ncbi:hypothetical protein [Clostridium cibarium]|uniref:DUF5659 domain-containing protein n=1 Tax=Clostridium cibarium TaxID=2762247 RepID=A0ABR8PNJ4_9CLOT|nr:hypothetical protein [Clostridium cibarium]MBD7909735.1 hypothetical protein [Clostridium cibarium]
MYVCKTIRLMNYLAKKYDVLKVVRDKDNPSYSVFLFNDNEEFRNYLSEYRK